MHNIRESGFWSGRRPAAPFEGCFYTGEALHPIEGQIPERLPEPFSPLAIRLHSGHVDPSISSEHKMAGAA